MGYDTVNMGLFATGDLGYDFYYQISIFNNTIANAKNAYVMDVLPYNGDHYIVANDKGEYLNRQSVYATPLSAAIEDIPENAAALAKFDVFYQLSDQGADVESVRDGAWVTKDQVTDFSKVKSFKFVLKAGQEIESKSEVKFFIKSKIPYSEVLNPGDLAINSTAISTDGTLYSEGNSVRVTFEKYKVTGKFFKDFNKDGILDSTEDGVESRKVELIDALTGNIATDFNGNPITTTTDKNGKYSLDVYKRGSYKIRFTKLDSEEFGSVNGNRINQNNVKETPADTQYGLTQEFLLNPITNSAILNGGIISTNRDINIVKTSSDADENGVKKAIQGVEFSLVKDGAPVQKQVTDKDGKITFKNVPFGSYKLVESKAAEGYEILEPNGRDITIGEDAFDVQVFENKPIKRNITLAKVDAQNNELKLKGVVFALFSEKDLNTEIKRAETDENGVVTFENIPYGKYKIKEISTKEGYVLKSEPIDVNVSENNAAAIDLGDIANEKIKGSIIVTKADADDNAKKLQGVMFALKQGDDEIATATTDVNGIATFENVVYGDYKLIEKTPLENYNKSDREVNVSIKTNGQRFDAGIFENSLKKGKVTVSKVDADDNAKKLQGVVFALKQGDDEIATATTDVNGIATFENVVYGDYKLIEKTPLENYNKSDKAVDVSVKTQGQEVNGGIFENTLKKGKVTLIKADSDNENKKLKGVSFALKQNGATKYSGVTDEKGILNIENVVYGKYELVETGTLANYNLPSEDAFKKSHPINITANGQVIDLGIVTNTIKKGTVKVTKTDAQDNKKLQGVVFALKQNDTEVMTATTDKDGIATFENVVYGDYKLVEKTPLENYNSTDKSVEISLRTNGQNIDAGVFENTIKKGSVVVTKADADDNAKKLQGVVFALKQGDNEIATATTDVNGIATFENVVYGDYKLIEKTPLENYNKSDREVNVSIKTNGQRFDAGIFENSLKKGKVTVSKVDADDNAKKLQGVVFALKQGDDEIATATTDVNGIATFENVVYGEYKLVEKTPLESYNANGKSVDIKIESDGQVIDGGIFENAIKRGKITISKVDADDNAKKLQGVVFALKQDGEDKYLAETDENGIASFDGVQYGKYILYEKATLENYNLSEEERSVEIKNQDDNIVLDDFTNEIKRGSIRILKVDDSGKALAGVEFSLKQDGKVIEKKATDERGIASFDNLAYGDYEVVESAELSGYYKNNEIHVFKIRENGKVLEKKVINKKIPVKAPKTGDDFNGETTGLALLCSIVSIGILIRRKSIKNKH